MASDVPAAGAPTQELDAPAMVLSSMYIGLCMSAGVSSCAVCLPSTYQVILSTSQSTP